MHVRNFIQNIHFILIRGKAVAQMSYEAQKDGKKAAKWLEQSFVSKETALK